MFCSTYGKSVRTKGQNWDFRRALLHTRTRCYSHAVTRRYVANVASSCKRKSARSAGNHVAVTPVDPLLHRQHFSSSRPPCRSIVFSGVGVFYIGSMRSWHMLKEDNPSNFDHCFDLPHPRFPFFFALAEPFATQVQEPRPSPPLTTDWRRSFGLFRIQIRPRREVRGGRFFFLLAGQYGPTRLHPRGSMRLANGAVHLTSGGRSMALYCSALKV